MRKLVLVLFGLTALNTYADVTQGALRRITLLYVLMVTIQIAVEMQGVTLPKYA